MEKDSKKKNASEINEEFMMNLMVDGVKQEGLELPPRPLDKSTKEEIKEPLLNNPKSKGKKRTQKTSRVDYETLFFKKTETNARDGKTVYIRPEFHERLTRIVRVIGEDKLSIYAYLDNLLDYHFQEFGKEITKSFNDKYKPIL